MRGITRLEFDCLREAERAHGVPSPLPITTEYSPEHLKTFAGLTKRELIAWTTCGHPSCLHAYGDAGTHHYVLTATGRMLLAWARLPDTAIICAD